MFCTHLYLCWYWSVFKLLGSNWWQQNTAKCWYYLSLPFGFKHELKVWFWGSFRTVLSQISLKINFVQRGNRNHLVAVMHVCWVGIDNTEIRILGSVATVWMLGVPGKFWQHPEAEFKFARNEQSGWYLYKSRFTQDARSYVSKELWEICIGD